MVPPQRLVAAKNFPSADHATANPVPSVGKRIVTAAVIHTDWSCFWHLVSKTALVNASVIEASAILYCPVRNTTMGL